MFPVNLSSWPTLIPASLWKEVKRTENDVSSPPIEPSGFFTPQEKRKTAKKTNQYIQMSYQDLQMSYLGVLYCPEKKR